jgi:hypothetical protein
VFFASPDSVIAGNKIPVMGAILAIALILGFHQNLKMSAILIRDKARGRADDQGRRRFRLVRASSRDA